MAEGKLVLERIAICHQLGFFLDDEAATKNRPTSSSNGPLAVNLFLARMIGDATSRFGNVGEQIVMGSGGNSKA
jgi:hypothetical protein